MIVTAERTTPVLPRPSDRLRAVRTGALLAVVGAITRVPLIDGTTRTYANLDNAASAPALERVASRVNEVLPLYASVHRGAGYLSQVSTALYESSRQTIARFVGAREDDVAIIIRNTTDTLNLLAGCVPDGGRVLVLDLEHHANLLPWQRGTATVLPIEDTVAETLAALTVQLARVAYALVATTGASNVTGEAHRGFSLAETGADYVAFSGHKTYAPFGAGALIGRRDWLDDAPAYLAGGGAVREVGPDRTVWTTVPARHEAGSPNVIGAIALAEACEALAALPAGALAEHEDALRTRLVEGLGAIDGVDVLHIWPDSVKPVGVVTFNVIGHDPGLVAAYLAAEHGIGVRDGRFCAHPLLARLGAPSGAVRASVGVGTGLEAVERLISAVQAYVTTGLTARYVVVDGCWAIADDPRPLIQVHGLLGLAAQVAACTSTAE
jgi:selenocysteine lyase/cysteine desulfurase